MSSYYAHELLNLLNQSKHINNDLAQVLVEDPEFTAQYVKLIDDYWHMGYMNGRQDEVDAERRRKQDTTKERLYY